jgi:hypothetical protein
LQRDISLADGNCSLVRNFASFADSNGTMPTNRQPSRLSRFISILEDLSLDSGWKHEQSKAAQLAFPKQMWLWQRVRIID